MSQLLALMLQDVCPKHSSVTMPRASAESQAVLTTQPSRQVPKGVPYETNGMARIVLFPGGHSSCTAYPSPHEPHTFVATHSGDEDGVADGEGARLALGGGDSVELAVVHPTQLAVAVAEAEAVSLADAVELRVRMGDAEALRVASAEGDAELGTQPTTICSVSGALSVQLPAGLPSASRVASTGQAASSGAPGGATQAAVTASTMPEVLHAPGTKARQAPVGCPHAARMMEKMEKPASQATIAVPPSSAAAHAGVTSAGCAESDTEPE